MVVAVVAVRMVQVAVDEIVDMIAVRNLRVATIRAVDVPRLMAAALVMGRAFIGVRRSHRQHALINMVAMVMMQVTVVQVINVSVVLDGQMTATRTMLMFVAFRFVAGTHVVLLFESLC